DRAARAPRPARTPPRPARQGTRPAGIGHRRGHRPAPGVRPGDRIPARGHHRRTALGRRRHPRPARRAHRLERRGTARRRRRAPHPRRGSPMTPKVIVIGAGTGGMCLAHGLRRAGVDVAVYERDRTRADALYGHRVGIDADGRRALRECLPPDLYDTFVAPCARPPRFFNVYTEKLRRTASFALPDTADEHSVSRMTLRQVLLT